MNEKIRVRKKVVVGPLVVYLFRQEQTIHYTHNTKRTITEAGHQKGR